MMTLVLQCSGCDEKLTNVTLNKERFTRDAERRGWRVATEYGDRDYCPSCAAYYDEKAARLIGSRNCPKEVP